LVAKIGAEGVQAIGLRGDGIGIAVKIADGSRRALRPFSRRCSKSWGPRQRARRTMLADWIEPTIRNYRGFPQDGSGPPLSWTSLSGRKSCRFRSK
jgi:L-asparaginase II